MGLASSITLPVTSRFTCVTVILRRVTDSSGRMTKLSLGREGMTTTMGVTW